MFGGNQVMELTCRREEPWHIARENTKDESRLQTGSSGLGEEGAAGPRSHSLGNSTMELGREEGVHSAG